MCDLPAHLKQLFIDNVKAHSSNSLVLTEHKDTELCQYFVDWQSSWDTLQLKNTPEKFKRTIASFFGCFICMTDNSPKNHYSFILRFDGYTSGINYPHLELFVRQERTKIHVCTKACKPVRLSFVQRVNVAITGRLPKPVIIHKSSDEVFPHIQRSFNVVARDTVNIQ